MMTSMSRFVRPEPIDGSTRVVRLFDTAHVAHRACRTVRAGEASFDEVRDRVRRLARLSHPNLARVVAVGEEGGDLKVVTEWLPGGAFTAAGEASCAALLVGPAEALYALHREGLAHGHVEARSLVLDGDGLLRLVDGGVRDGSVHEDLVAFGALLEALYVGRPMPGRLARVAARAKRGGFGDARALADALRDASGEPTLRDRPEGDLPSEDARLVDTAVPVRLREASGPDDSRRWLLVLTLAFLVALLLVAAAGLLGWWVGMTAPPAVPVAPAVP